MHTKKTDKTDKWTIRTTSARQAEVTAKDNLASCGHPLPLPMNTWTRGAASRHTTAPISQLGLHPVVRKPLLISHSAEGRRQSWPDHTV